MYSTFYINRSQKKCLHFMEIHRQKVLYVLQKLIRESTSHFCKNRLEKYPMFYGNR
ncbi:unnamed protein product, partial [Larinioides sclopetarius]